MGSARLEASRTRVDPGAEGTSGAHKHAWIGGGEDGNGSSETWQGPRCTPHSKENGPHSEALLVQLECLQGIQLPF